MVRPNDDKPFARSTRGFGRPPIAIGELFDRLPPNAPEAEMSLLGSLILDTRMVAFCNPRHSQ
jgi:hypothetical protein